MELIFNHQICQQRVITGRIGRARRKWTHLYTWFPKEQRHLYSNMDRIYKEVQEKHDPEMFMDYGKERRLNNRIIKEELNENEDRDDFNKYPCLKPILDKYGRIPLFYFKEKCGDPDFCQQKKNQAIP